MAGVTDTPKRQRDFKSDNFFNGQWLREVTVWERLFSDYYKKGTFLNWYQLGLKSESPLQEDDIKKALGHLYRKCPNLSVCLGYRNGTLWVRRATNPEVDFKVLQGTSLNKVKEFLFKYDYNLETGPLFCCRLVVKPRDAVTGMDDEEPEMHCTSYLFLGLCHIFTDGTSNINIMRLLITLLNDVVANKPIDDEELLGTFCSDERTQAIVNEKEFVLENHPRMMRLLKEESEKLSTFCPISAKFFLMPNAEKIDTKCYSKLLDRVTTSKFRTRCAKEGVTINSAFASVLNMTLVDLLVERGNICDSYEFQNSHCVNLRRYWKKTFPDALGLHIGFPIVTYKETPRNAENGFWSYARSMNQDINADICSGKILTKQAFETRKDPGMRFLAISAHEPPRYSSDYVISNMGDITSIVTEGGEKIRISHILRSSSPMDTDVLQIACHTFRGKFVMTFAYNRVFISDDFPRKFCEKTAKKMQEVAL